jgi:hypothetical protein
MALTLITCQKSYYTLRKLGESQKLTFITFFLFWGKWSKCVLKSQKQSYNAIATRLCPICVKNALQGSLM